MTKKFGTNMKNYNEEFQKAVENAKQFSLWDKEVEFGNTTYIADWLMYELGPKIAENFTLNGYVRFLRQPQNAVRVHHMFKPIVDELLKVDCMITTGYVKVANDADEVEEFGKIDTKIVEKALADKILPEKIHTWLTLPSGEIIDVAFMTIYGILYSEDSLIGNIVAKAPKDFTGGMEYYPVLVGEEFYEKCAFDFSFNKDLYNTDELEDEDA
ncbi:MAG: hypothetical protein OEW60_04480 [Thiovulaceae bacterium]|nr:hypothetical protein [Sulfurimonadaceae bacterium]